MLAAHLLNYIWGPLLRTHGVKQIYFVKNLCFRRDHPSLVYLIGTSIVPLLTKDHFCDNLHPVGLVVMALQVSPDLCF
jgi:hypothetical protein